MANDKPFSGSGSFINRLGLVFFSLLLLIGKDPSLCNIRSKKKRLINQKNSKKTKKCMLRYILVSSNYNTAFFENLLSISSLDLTQSHFSGPKENLGRTPLLPEKFFNFSLLIVNLPLPEVFSCPKSCEFDVNFIFFEK